MRVIYLIHKDLATITIITDIKASQLINELSKVEKLDNYQEELFIYDGYGLLIGDDFGLMSMDVNKCRNLFEVFNSMDPHKSILAISRFPVSS